MLFGGNGCGGMREMSRRDVRDAVVIFVLCRVEFRARRSSRSSRLARERCSLDILFVPVRLDSVVLRASVLVLDRTIARVASRPVASIVSPLVRAREFRLDSRALRDLDRRRARRRVDGANALVRALKSLRRFARVCLGPTARSPCALRSCSRFLLSKNTACANLGASTRTPNNGNSTRRHAVVRDVTETPPRSFPLARTPAAFAAAFAAAALFALFSPAPDPDSAPIAVVVGTCCRSQMYDLDAPGATGYRRGTSSTLAS